MARYIFCSNLYSHNCYIYITIPSLHIHIAITNYMSIFKEKIHSYCTVLYGFALLHELTCSCYNLACIDYSIHQVYIAYRTPCIDYSIHQVYIAYRTPCARHGCVGSSLKTKYKHRIQSGESVLCNNCVYLLYDKTLYCNLNTSTIKI